MKLFDPDIGLRWSLSNALMKVGYAALVVALFVGCGRLMAPDY